LLLLLKLAILTVWKLAQLRSQLMLQLQALRRRCRMRRLLRLLLRLLLLTSSRHHVHRLLSSRLI
jgi:hypothetical protein